MAEKSTPAEIFKLALQKTLEEKYSNINPPPAYVTPFDVKTVDTLLGGGILSSMNLLQSTPETGKSTIALQYCANFLETYPNAIALYIDRESTEYDEKIQDRLATFGIDKNRFMYRSTVGDVKDIYKMVVEAVDIKQKVFKKSGVECYLTIVWDSIAATPSSKHGDAEDPKSLIGFKANELSLYLAKLTTPIAMERINFIIIDQIRSNIEIEMPWQKAQNQKSVGVFGNVKGATNVQALSHSIRQWLFLSKGDTLSPSDTFGVDGWIINLYVEKNKLASSQYSVPIVFDKKYGVVKIWSEYYFLSNMTKTEKKYWKEESKLVYPLSITGATNKRVLSVMDPTSGEVLFEDQFNERNFLSKYAEDENFQMWFDKAVDIACEQRIKKALFRDVTGTIQSVHVESDPDFDPDPDTTFVPPHEIENTVGRYEPTPYGDV